MSARRGKSQRLVGLTQIRKWEREYAALGRQAKKIEDKRGVMKTMIDAAKKLAVREPEPDQPPPSARRKRSASTPRRGRMPAAAAPIAGGAASTSTATAPPVKIDRRRRPKSEWKAIIREIALTSNHPVPYTEARDEIMKTPLAEKLQRSEKGFYHAISNLSKAGEIVAYKGHLFSPEMFAKFKTDLNAGLIRDLKIHNAAHRSPMGDAIKQMMQTRPNGAQSGHIIWELRKNPEFAAIIEKNKTHPYNVLARLLKTEELTKRGKRYYSAVVKSEAPAAGKAEGASIVTGEGLTVAPLLFAQPGESRSG